MKGRWHEKFLSLFEKRKIWFHILGIAALLWFIFRSGPAPHRTQYPCQQASRSIAAVYIAYWSAMLIGFSAYLNKIKTKFASFLPLAVIFIILAGGMGGSMLAGKRSHFNPIPNEPMGVPTGLNPGRVVWVWNPHATSSQLKGYWWEGINNNQTVIDEMFEKGIKALAGVDDLKEAWNMLFSYFNSQHGKGNVSYRAGEKIAIKINMNNCWDAENNYAKKDNDRDASPYVVKSLLRQLINVVGVPQEDIILYDASRPIPDWFYYRVYYKNYPDSMTPEFPDVNFYDNVGKEGRHKVEASNVRIYFAEGPCKYRTLPKCVVEADYIINMPLLKMHPINNGVTLSGKNFFGSWIEEVSDIHDYHESGQIMGNPAPQVDLLAHKHLGGKTLIYIGDGTFGTLKDHKTIAKFQMYPFNDDWTNSLFFSQDPVAIDSVMFDFLNEEANPIEGAQNYLHQAAEPPPGVYDPEGDGVYLSHSLGVHEHWNTSVNIFSPERYTGHGYGIDFVPIGEEYATPSIRIISPKPNHFYIYGKDVATLPLTIIIGNITVEGKIEGVEKNVEKMEFYLDGKLMKEDTTPPYTWEWKEMAWMKHELKLVAYYDGESIVKEMVVWKFL